MTNFILPNNISSMNYALKSVPGSPDVEVPHGDWDGPRTPARCKGGGSWKSFKWLILICLSMSPLWNMLLKSVTGLADIRVPHGDGDCPRPPPWCLEGVMKKFQMTNFDMPNNISYLKHALKTVTGLADVGVLHGDGDGPRAPSRCMEGVWKNFKWHILICPTMSLLWKMQ